MDEKIAQELFDALEAYTKIAQMVYDNMTGFNVYGMKSTLEKRTISAHKALDRAREYKESQKLNDKG